LTAWKSTLNISKKKFQRKKWKKGAGVNLTSAYNARRTAKLKINQQSFKKKEEANERIVATFPSVYLPASVRRS
jgi:hypothetical protein